MRKEGRAMITRRGFMGGAAAIAASTIMSRYAMSSAAGMEMSKP
ncbi:MAG: twin-arginine translocation signal domain-containing protein [Sedimentisphaerales bacterium]|nr:twin-arginine translocation signal domain-containing protein [Sedimentisphaerales bacterium]